MERKWVLAAFLDITGFRSWTYRASTAPEMKVHFIGTLYDVFQRYVRKHTASWVKYEGDGVLIIREFSKKQRIDDRSQLNFLKSLRCLYRKVRNVIRDAESAPEGVRIRLIRGYVFKLMVVDPHDPQRKRLVPEYLEYCTNTVRGLLEVNPEIPCLATKGMVQDIGKGRSSFRVRPLGQPSSYPKGVNREDIDGLEIVKF